MHSTPTAAKAQPAKPTQAAVCVSATVELNRCAVASVPAFGIVHIVAIQHLPAF